MYKMKKMTASNLTAWLGCYGRTNETRSWLKIEQLKDIVVDLVNNVRHMKSFRQSVNDFSKEM